MLNTHINLPALVVPTDDDNDDNAWTERAKTLLEEENRAPDDIGLSADRERKLIAHVLEARVGPITGAARRAIVS